MDTVATEPAVLLAEARAAGLTVRADGDRLVVRGSRAHAGVVERLLADKAAVLAALAGEWEAEVAWRVAVMAPQVLDTGTIPFLVARPNQVRPGGCVSCGDPMEAGQRFKCRACSEAARRTVAADEAARVARRSTGGRP